MARVAECHDAEYQGECGKESGIGGSAGHKITAQESVQDLQALGDGVRDVR